ncbi:MAG: ATP-binding protein [Lachnospiraceae bacterium]|nr:ATP-binding protein [Lachnospiraceae bacterium]
MKKRIDAQLILIAVLGILSTMIIMLFVFYNLYQDTVFNDLKHTADLLKSAQVFEEGEARNRNMEFDDLRVTWIDKDGTVLFDNDANIGYMNNHSDRPEIEKAREQGYGKDIRESATMQRSTYYYAVLNDDGTVVRVAKEASSLWNMFLRVAPSTLLVLLTIGLISIVIAHGMTSRIINPIEEMARNIDDFTVEPTYPELAPFVSIIRSQHTAILESARMRQDFTANVSHELKTPLTAISGYAELMENKMIQGDSVPEYAGKISKNANRLLTLINDIIELSELDSTDGKVDFVNLDIADICKQCVESLKMNAIKHEVTISYIGTPAIINGNVDMIRELVTNLCDNAIRYNKKGGYVTVATGEREGHGYVLVQDTGIGIPKLSQDRVFERFYRVDKSRSKQTGGTGLGLAIVKHIVMIHDAEINLKSEVGQGTTITVVFP